MKLNDLTNKRQNSKPRRKGHKIKKMTINGRKCIGTEEILSRKAQLLLRSSSLPVYKGESNIETMDTTKNQLIETTSLAHFELRTNDWNSKQGFIVQELQNGMQTRTLEYRLTKHAACRMALRGICQEDLLYVIDYGKTWYKQGLTFVTIRRKDLDDCSPCRIKKLNNLVVVLDGSGSTVITCYRSPNGHNHLKRKSKQYYAQMEERSIAKRAA